MWVKNVLNGWGNYINGSETINELARDRAKKCSTCIHLVTESLLRKLPDAITTIQGKKCNKCGCPLSSKLRSLNEHCPIKLW
jgi:hypothetical protein